MTKVLDKGEVRLLNSMGGDLAVVAAARVSNGVDYFEASKGEESDQRLINYLVKHRHGTPFEHSTFQFFVKAPLFVVREWQRHRMASYNEISGRYVEFEPEFYYPEAFRRQSKSNKQGSVEVPSDDPWQHDLHNSFSDATLDSYEKYLYLLEEGVAKEMARMVLPLNLYSQFYFTVNARSLMNFLSLRNAADAQFEIRKYAEAIEPMFKQAMPLTYEAWTNNDRLAP